MIILELMELFWLSFENMAEIKEPEQGLKTPQLLFFNLNPALKDGASELLHFTKIIPKAMEIINPDKIYNQQASYRIGVLLNE